MLKTITRTEEVRVCDNCEKTLTPAGFTLKDNKELCTSCYRELYPEDFIKGDRV